MLLLASTAGIGNCIPGTPLAGRKARGEGARRLAVA